MLKERVKLVAFSLYFTDMAATIFSFIAACCFRDACLGHWNISRLYPLGRDTWLIVAIVLIWTALLRRYKAYKSFRVSTFRQEMTAVGKAVLLGGLILGTGAFVLELEYLRALIPVFIAFNLLFLTVERFSVRHLSRYARSRGYNFRRVVIVGINEAARDVAARIERCNHWGLRITGFISDGGEFAADSFAGYPVIGSISGLEEVLKREVVDEVIFSVPGKQLDKLEDTFLMIEDYGISARISANIFPRVNARVRLEELDTIPLLTFSTVPTSMLSLALKRLFDIVAAIVLMILSAPVMLVTALLVKLTSPGPVLFRQQRCGLNGRTFICLKFRSMHVDAENRRSELEGLNEMSGPAFKIRNDPRVTPVGRVIRKMSIDELPQLWNVVKGDMSIVGPRPPVPGEVAEYARWQRRRLSMRPGLTCLWQINGRNKTSDFNEWVRLDLLYIDSWSLMLDFKIFFKTVPAVLFQKGAS